MTTLIADIISALTTAGYSNLRPTQFDPYSEDQIVVGEYAGQAPILSVDSATRRPGITIMVRDEVLETAYGRALDIWQLFACSKSLPGHQVIQATNSGLTHDIDENGKHIFIMSFYVFD